MRKSTWRGMIRWGLISAAVLAVFLGLMMEEAQAPVEEDKTARQETPAPAASVSENREKIEKNCQIIQTMAFSRCGHSVTRRVAPPEKLAGADFETAQAYYDQWRIESFAGDQITMVREIELFCPIHMVLGVSEAGEVILCRNIYGDGMAAQKTYDASLEAFSEKDQEALLQGMGFDSETEADAWVNEHKNP